jgi:hypothetical protein
MGPVPLVPAGRIGYRIVEPVIATQTRHGAEFGNKAEGKKFF